MNVADVLFLLAFFGIWITQLYWMWLSLGAYLYSRKSAANARQRNQIQFESWPSVTVLVPAHNEAVVIESTLRALVASDYAADRYEVLLIDDGSTDNTREIAERVAAEHPQIKIVAVPRGEGAKASHARSTSAWRRPPVISWRSMTLITRPNRIACAAWLQHSAATPRWWRSTAGYAPAIGRTTG